MSFALSSPQGTQDSLHTKGSFPTTNFTSNCNKNTLSPWTQLCYTSAWTCCSRVAAVAAQGGAYYRLLPEQKLCLPLPILRMPPKKNFPANLPLKDSDPKRTLMPRVNVVCEKMIRSLESKRLTQINQEKSQPYLLQLLRLHNPSLLHPNSDLPLQRMNHAEDQVRALQRLRVR